MAWNDYTRARCGQDKNVIQSMARWMRDRQRFLCEMPIPVWQTSAASFTTGTPAIQMTFYLWLPYVADDTAFSLWMAPTIKSSDGTTQFTLYLEDSAGNDNSSNGVAYTPGTSYSTSLTETTPLELPLGSQTPGGSGKGYRTIELWGSRDSGTGTCNVATEDTDASPNVRIWSCWIEEAP